MLKLIEGSSQWRRIRIESGVNTPISTFLGGIGDFMSARYNNVIIVW